MGFAFTHAQHGFFVGRDYWVAPNDQIGASCAHTRCANVCRVGADQNVAPGAAAFLSKSCSILRDDAFALKVCGHPQQLTNGNDPGTANTCHHNAPHRVVCTQQGQHGGRQFT